MKKIKKSRVPEAVTPAAESASPESAPFLNRELMWLEFNRRVLHEACDPRTPLLERIKFLGIFTFNLDEFFMKRVGGFKRQILAGVTHRSADGMRPEQQLAAIRNQVLPMLRLQATCFERDIKPALAQRHIDLTPWAKLTGPEREAAHGYFKTRVFPVLTPLAVDPGHPFPFISNLSTSLGVMLKHPDTAEDFFARIKIPKVLPQWIRLETADGNDRFLFVSLIDLIRHNLDMLFPEMDVRQVMPFRITRNADVERDEEDTEDLLALIEQEIRQRRFEKVVRMEHGPNPHPEMLKLLIDELEIAPDDLYEIAGGLDYTDLQTIAELNLPALHYAPWTPLVPPALAAEQSDIFSLIRGSDILVHHPYEDFTASVERFIRAAAEDPKVLAIKMTLYRISDESPFIRTLIQAAEEGKQIVCLVELKARFDEERNIYWAQLMEKAGIHVVYGLVGLKTHAKITLVIREEAEGLRSYAHIGTGNYHSQTAKLYTDLGLLTCRPELTEEIIELFNYLTGRSLNRNYRKLLIAPVNMRERFLALIEREIGHRQAGRPAGIIAKMNSLEEDKICRALYCASQAGVEITLLVRGFCCLSPGVPGVSENIRVLSVIGRFLEHSRIFYFRNGAADPLDGEFFIGSADWMYRNLLARVEAITPIETRALREKCWEILQTLIRDERQAWEMQPDGSYVQRQPCHPEYSLGTHETLMQLTRQRMAPA
ncbi:MAG: polyphosphate kinase 1 [Verrucomicrobia bacterium]|nr:polyphosphate kinase 1 [Verrucomicrobiota bacterium]MCG2678977.1 polyphosphate kinase 1 [Kiritimatiellia bacterium]MBU4247633.1 polyphosphate kinase 1 [Verrucomicrobiota bacterium]MBU4290814.1 polyphosphate kinase 1 [Verrucomicrobiota bacterium]MBU4427865.1 polyphosphate kinase 1 [Verrucomicrobiota bacterium]